MTKEASDAVEDAVTKAVSQFGATVLPRLVRRIGEPEDQLRGPLEQMLRAVAKSMELHGLVPHGESALPELRVRPDYAIAIGSVVCGYVELKAPGKGADPWVWRPRSRDRQQWEKLKALPNVLYTDGNEWALYRTQERVGNIARVHGDVRKSGKQLRPADSQLHRVLTDFLSWVPQSPESLGQLVKNVAGLCRLLRGEVADALSLERAGSGDTRFSVLAEDWRDLLFPGLSDEGFSDAYAQTVTFALLLARVEGISFSDRSVQEIALLLGKGHSLMGKALAVLTEGLLIGKLSVTVDMLVRVIGAVDWDRLDDRSQDAYLYLYERFLEEYDPELRKQTGSYYTPTDVVGFMVRFVDEILQTRLGQPLGFAGDSVVTVDPAMGTGTFLINIVARVARLVDREEGEGARPARLRELAKRLIGFERQTGPYAVAELRVHEAFRIFATDPPAEGLRLYVADTLDNPFIVETHLGGSYEPIARSRREANKVKANENVLVVIGNPPYRDKAKGLGGWIEKGDPGTGEAVPLDAFRAAGLGRLEYVLSNLYVYFWRWATWKVFDAHPDASTGVVAFITTSAFASGPGFAGMREYLRRTADDGWIIDVSPEHYRPAVSTRFFPGVQQPLCISIFAHYGLSKPDTPAKVHYVAIEGSREEKFRRLGTIDLQDNAWEACPTGWREPFLPSVGIAWESFPAVKDLIPWSAPGVKPNRTWVYAPHEATLRARWDRLVKAPPDEKGNLLKETRDRTIDSRVSQIEGLSPGIGTLRDEVRPCPKPVRIAYRSFDRQWLIPDNRVVDFLRPALWRVYSDNQVYLSEGPREPVTGGPALTFTAEPPDMNHYRGRDGAVRPLYRDIAGLTPNLAPGLLGFLTERLGVTITAEDVFSYTAAVTAHSGFSHRFSKELETPGVRIPLTADAALFQEAAKIGRRVVWLHTFGQRLSNISERRPPEPPRLPSDRRPKVVVAIPDTVEDMPHGVTYEAATQTLNVGSGRIKPVPPAVWEFQVSGMRVVRKWFSYRSREPQNRRSTPLDDINATRWTATTTSELLELLNVLGYLVELESKQSAILDRIMSSPLISLEDLNSSGILPVPASARKPLQIDDSVQGEMF